MRIDEQGGAAATPAQDLDHAAIGHLAETATAELLGHASTQHSQPAEAADHRVGDFGLAINRHRVDLLLAEGRQVGHGSVGAGVGVQIGIGRQRVVRIAAKKQALWRNSSPRGDRPGLLPLRPIVGRDPSGSSATFLARAGTVRMER